MIPNIKIISEDISDADLRNEVARLQKTIRQILTKGLESDNMIEIGQWMIDNDMIHADDGDVGLSTRDTGADDVRFWAGDAIDGSPKFKVTKAGILTAVAAVFMSALGYPKVTFNMNANLLQAFSDANNHVDITPNAGGSPGISWTVANVLNAYLQSTVAGPLYSSFNSTPITIQPATNLNLSIAGGGLNMTIGNNLTINGSPGYTGSYSVVTGVNFTTQTVTTKTVTVTKGIVTNVT